MVMMSPLDMALLVGEIGSRTLHVGVLMVFEMPPDGPETFTADAYRDALIAGRVRKALTLRPTVAGGGLPRWEPTDDIDMSRHVQRLALPDPGTDAELFTLVARLHELRLDRSRPMWEGYLIEGLAGGRFAVYIKIHHALLDGMSGIRMLEQSLSPDPRRRGMPLMPAGDDPRPASRPAQPALLRALDPRRLEPRNLVRNGLSAATTTVGLAGRTALSALDWLGRAVTTESTPAPMRAPRTALERRTGPERVFAGGSWPEKRLRAVQRATGASTNDVILAMCGGALRNYLTKRNTLPSSSLVALVPIAQRRREDATGGNALGVALCSLGTDLDDPATRLHRIRRSMADSKRRIRSAGVGAAVLAVPMVAPNIARILPLGGGLLPPSYNLVISDVPGPRRPLYWNGAPLAHMYPLSVVFDGTGLNITVCRWADRLDFGFLAHPESVPDPECLTNEVETALGDLERTAEGHSP